MGANRVPHSLKLTENLEVPQNFVLDEFFYLFTLDAAKLYFPGAQKVYFLCFFSIQVQNILFNELDGTKFGDYVHYKGNISANKKGNLFKVLSVDTNNEVALKVGRQFKNEVQVFVK